MTTKVIPARLWETVLRYVAPDMPEHMEGQTTVTPSPFSAGYPDGPGAEDFSLRWDAEFTTEQDAEWDRILKAAERVHLPTMHELLDDADTG